MRKLTELRKPRTLSPTKRSQLSRTIGAARRSALKGGDTKLTVFFEKAGKRRLIARYANLELL